MTTTSPRIPLWIKIAYTIFIAILVPIYLKRYGPTNFLYFCNVAFFATLAGVWLESAVILSATLVGIFLPQMLWVFDFLFEIAGRIGDKEIHLTGMTTYMFRPPYFLRVLSLYHGWLPFFLIWLVWRVGYDRRGVLVWSGMMWVLLTICYAGMPAASPSVDPPFTKDPLDWTVQGDIVGHVAERVDLPANALLTLIDKDGKAVAHTRIHADGSYVFKEIGAGKYRVQLRHPDQPVNINYVYSLTSDERPQDWIEDQDLYLTVYMVSLLALIYLPTHLLFSRLLPAARRPPA